MFLKMPKFVGISAVFAVLVCFTSAEESCPSFREYFSICKRDSPNFDECLVAALNRVKSCYHQGDPSLNIPPFEPIEYGAITDPVRTTLRYPSFFSLDITLPNITEWAWANSTYTKVKTDFNRKMVQIYQTVPLKHVLSDIIVDGDIMGVPVINRRGEMLLDMIGVKQRFTIQMQPNGKLKVNLIILSVNDLVMEFRRIVHDDMAENVVNKGIKRFWRMGYGFFKSFAYEISDKAKTKLFNQLFKQIDWENLFATSPATFDTSNNIRR